MNEEEWRTCGDRNKLQFEWLATTNKDGMLAYVHLRSGINDERKWRLFGCACARLCWCLLNEAVDRPAVVVVERFADNLATRDELAAARDASSTYRNSSLSLAATESRRRLTAYYANFVVLSAAGHIAVPSCRGAGGYAGLALAQGSQPPDELVADTGFLPESQAIADAAISRVVRCIFGNPFRPVAADPALRTATVVALATAAYTERLAPSGELDPVRLAVLADAVEDLTSLPPAIGDHLRESGPHFRGCWAVDTLMGR